MAATRVSIVPHTHWDREWYEPFQTYRLKLVALLDEFLPLLERDPGYRHFLLDGQMAVIDDYLEVRPEAEETLRRLVASGRLSVGPWMILMDEFMVSGETMIRNLQMGLRRAAEFGGAMEVGYLPDMFGHVAQMPQILARAGLEHAVVWRGVPNEILSTGFWWEAPDGSKVRAEYLYGSYSNGRDIPRDPDLLVERARNYETELGSARLDGMLLMNGTDHQVPQAWLGDVVAAANAAQGDYEFRVTSLPDHIARQPTDGLPTWRGELRSGARSNVLMGVASNRVDVHQAAAAAERSLERRAEPLAALVHGPEGYPGRLLDVAWRNLVLNSAHDSSCACSHDEVVDQVLVRYREARQIADGIARDAVHLMGAVVDAPTGSTVVVNPTQWTRAGLVDVRVPGEGPLYFESPDGTTLPAQVIDPPSGGETGERFATQVVGPKIGWVLDMLRGEEFAGAPVKGYDVEPRSENTWNVTIHGAGRGDERADVGGLREHIMELAASPDSVFHIRMLRPPTRHALLLTDDVPGYGWRTYIPRDGFPHDGRLGKGAVDHAPVSANGHRITNEHVEVIANPDDGTFTLISGDTVTAGLHRLVNGGDGGDTYNYSPPDHDVIVDRAVTVTVEVDEKGPLRARMTTRARYEWPTHALGDERNCSARAETTEPVDVATRLELRAGEPFVRVRVEFDNPCRDQRVRAHLPLPRAADASNAECAFAIVRRGLTAEGGPNEFGLPTFPSRRFVTAGGVAVIHDGLLEYEVIDGPAGQELALTLLRSVGFLSRIEPSLRPNPAGPPVPVRGAQMLGRQVMEYAVALQDAGADPAELYPLADAVLVPLERAPVRSAEPGPRAGSFLDVGGAVVSACHRTPGGLVLRVFNPTAAPTTVTVAKDGAAQTGWTVDLRGAPIDPFPGELTIGPDEIATILLPGA